MSTTDNLIPLLASAFIESCEVNYGFASLLIYDHILCFGEEVEYFWTGPWSLSRILYLATRYMGLGFALFSVADPNLTIRMTQPYQPSLVMVRIFVFILPISTLCQAIITLRIWFLFPRNLAVRIFAVALLVGTAIASTALLVMQWNTIRFEALYPFASASPSVALVYVPSLAIHSILFALQVYRFLTSSVRMQTNTLLWGFVKEGMFMFAFALASILFALVGLMMTDTSQLPIRIPAAAGSPIVALIVAVCRMMLNIRSVAATTHVDPEWLLNHAELSRVYWRRGNVDGEIIVEFDEPAISLHSHPSPA